MWFGTLPGRLGLGLNRQRMASRPPVHCNLTICLTVDRFMYYIFINMSLHVCMHMGTIIFSGAPSLPGVRLERLERQTDRWIDR